MRDHMDNFASIKRLFENLKLLIHSLIPHRAGVKYVRNVISEAVYSLLLFVFTVVAMGMILYLGKMMWFMYQSTPVGQQFILNYPERAAMVAEILADNPAYLSIELTLSAFLTCIFMGVVCQFLQLTRYFFIPYGAIKKIVFWALPLSGVVAWNLQSDYGYTDYKATYLLGLLPTLGVFSNCLEFTYRLVPEVSDVFATLTACSRHAKRKYPAIKQRIEAIIERINESE